MSTIPPPFFLFSGNSHPQFAAEVTAYLNIPLGKLEFQPYSDGEISLQVLENVRGKEVFVLQSLAKEPNDYLMELLILIDALKRASAKSITAILPYFCYARQDRKLKPRVPITAKLVANLLTVAGVHRVVTMDLHAGQIQGFFDIPLDNLLARPVLSRAFEKLQLTNLVIVAPDLGAIKNAQAYAEELEADFALIDKRRVDGRVEIEAVVGEVSGKNVLIVDDMCSTGETLIKAAAACKEKGALRIFAAITHGVLVKGALEKLVASPIEKIFISNTIAVPSIPNKIEVVSVAPLFGEAILRILSTESISSLFA
jgi:ribose-phosphate pyrophosphokinase